MDAERLRVIIEMIDQHLKSDMLTSSRNFLGKIRAVANGDEIPSKEVKKEPSKIIISGDASIKVNPGGPASVGIVIEIPGRKIMQVAQPTPATTNNQAEYDAVYMGLTTLVNLINNPPAPITVRSDSQLVIRQLKKEIECNDKKLLSRRDAILELVNQIPVPVTFEWRPRNSTPELELANHLAQDLLGVPRH
jgi:ribonuclease HI